jgi:23S rRNA (pseudouridine1915-N3)-methyltransferase
MKLRLIVVGSVGNRHLKALCDEFAGRVQKLLPFELMEIRDGKARDGEKRLLEEAESLRRKGEGGIGRLTGWTAWDAGGKALSSEAFSQWMDQRERDSQRQTWIIGSSHGLHADLKRDCEFSLGLGPMTYTHEMARFLVLEQLYRALCIQRHLPYHH